MLTIPPIASAVSLTDVELTRFFVAVVLLMALAHLGGTVFSRLRMPRVVGEIAGGLLLGPTALGSLFPDAQRWVFSGFESEGKLLAALSTFGLVLLMFISGLEVRARFDERDRRIALPVLAGATVVPFFIGLAAPHVVDLSSYLGPRGNTTSLAIVIGIATAITSIPVISKIFLDLGMMDTRFARIVLSVATVEDIILWGLLAVATGVAGDTNPTLSALLVKPAVTVLFFAVAMRGLPLLFTLARRTSARGLVDHRPHRLALLACFSLAALSSLAGVNVMFGALLAGMAVCTLPPEVVRDIRTRVKGIAMVFFVPIYFAVVGLKLDLVRQFDPLFFAGFLLFATLVKTAGTAVAGRVATGDGLSTMNLAAALNCRGGPGIVLATVAFDHGLIDERMFVTLVLTAVVTSLAAGSWFRYVLGRGWTLLRVRGEAEEPVPAADQVAPLALATQEVRP